MRTRRGIEEFSVSFLDVICCGFGAIILLLMLTKTFQPEVLEVSSIDLTEQVQQRQAALFEIRGKISELRRQIQLENSDLTSKLLELAELQSQLTKVLGRFDNLVEAEREISFENQQLASARQSLTDDMERLLGLDFRRDSGLVGGISVDSEYIIFLIDTSGSMRLSNYWNKVIGKVGEILAIYPKVKGIQVLSGGGSYMFPAQRRRWMEDSPVLRRNITSILGTYSNSSSDPIPGIKEAVGAFYEPDKSISIFIIGDDNSSNTTTEELLRSVDEINLASASGQRRVRIHAVAVPHTIPTIQARYSFLMSELAYRNDGTFVGLTQYQ